MLAYLGRTLLLGIAFLAASGCSGGNSSGDDDDSSASAVDKCKTLISEYCTNTIACGVSGGLVASGDQDSQVSDCKTNGSTPLDCSRAVDVTSLYDACIDNLKHPDCTKVNQGLMKGTVPLPINCNLVILID